MKHVVAVLVASVSLSACHTSGASEVNTVTTNGDVVPAFVTAICGECHAVVDSSVSPDPQAPNWADIANSPGLTRESLVVFLSDAHNYAMQMDVDLVEDDINLIADYMMTLQSEEYIKPPG